MFDHVGVTLRDPKGRALSGLSMGGRHTMFVGFGSLDLFASFGVLSAGDADAGEHGAEPECFVLERLRQGRRGRTVLPDSLGCVLILKASVFRRDWPKLKSSRP